MIWHFDLAHSNPLHQNLASKVLDKQICQQLQLHLLNWFRTQYKFSRHMAEDKIYIYVLLYGLSSNCYYKIGNSQLYRMSLIQVTCTEPWPQFHWTPLGWAAPQTSSSDIIAQPLITFAHMGVIVKCSQTCGRIVYISVKCWSKPDQFSSVMAGFYWIVFHNLTALY